MVVAMKMAAALNGQQCLAAGIRRKTKKWRRFAKRRVEASWAARTPVVMYINKLF
ncbi:hypothetical protein L499_A0574 [Bordetella holmesii CDC-H635-BH]|nr:hypothetical protein L499_A0574 [Bordetella holmesii CDC-H635-BH]KCV02504.1 hypothetical protein L498_0918 [Bordetella holmesii CDC-H629-BH]KCV10825.1 hypothetical protein L502_0554 [Bordetella holmesii CDC-H785-BH]